MKHIKNYINEKLHITTKSHLYSCQPKTKDELRSIISERIKDDGNDCDLNDIDVSKIEDMSYLFNANPDYNNGNKIFKDFNGDISQWDVSNVTDMCCIFNWCKQFNCDISKWNISNVKNITCMFNGCESFKQNLDKWDISNVKNMVLTFEGCPTKPEWYKKYK